MLKNRNYRLLHNMLCSLFCKTTIKTRNYAAPWDKEVLLRTTYCVHYFDKPQQKSEHPNLLSPHPACESPLGCNPQKSHRKRWLYLLIQTTKIKTT